MITKAVMEVAQYYTGFDYEPPRRQKDVNSQDRTILAGPALNPEPTFFLPGSSK